MLSIALVNADKKLPDAKEKVEDVVKFKETKNESYNSILVSELNFPYLVFSDFASLDNNPFSRIFPNYKVTKYMELTNDYNTNKKKLLKRTFHYFAKKNNQKHFIKIKLKTALDSLNYQTLNNAMNTKTTDDSQIVICPELLFFANIKHENILPPIQSISNLKFDIMIFHSQDFDLFDCTKHYVQLKERLDKTSVVPEIFIEKIFLKIYKVIKYLWDNRIFYYDLKIENILVKKNSDKNLKTLSVNDDYYLIDFELYIPRHSIESNKDHKKNYLYIINPQIRSSALITPPEAKTSYEWSERSIVWQLGCLLFCLINGFYPSNHQDNFDYYDLYIKWNINNDLSYLYKDMLELDPRKRLPFNKIEETAWFKRINK